MIFTCPTCLKEPQPDSRLPHKDRTFHQCGCGRLTYDHIDGSWTFRGWPTPPKSREYVVNRLTLLQDGSLWLNGLFVEVGREALVRRFIGQVLTMEVLES